MEPHIQVRVEGEILYIEFGDEQIILQGDWGNESRGAIREKIAEAIAARDEGET